VHFASSWRQFKSSAIGRGGAVAFCDRLYTAISASSSFWNWQLQIVIYCSNVSIARSEPDGTRWRTGGEVKGKDANGVGSQQLRTGRLSAVYTIAVPWSALLECQQSTELTPPPFQIDSSVSLKDQIWFLRVCHHVSNMLYLHWCCADIRPRYAELTCANIITDAWQFSNFCICFWHAVLSLHHHCTSLWMDNMFCPWKQNHIMECSSRTGA